MLLPRFAFLVLFIIPIATQAQEISFPAELNCTICTLPTKPVGPVRTILSVKRRGTFEIFDTDVETYDADGKQIEWINHSAGTVPEAPVGELVRLDTKTVYHYDAAARISHIDYFKLDGSSTGKEVFTYATNGDLLERTRYWGDKTPFHKNTFAYEPTKRNVVVTTTIYHKGKPGPTTRAIFTYNPKGQWIRRVIYDSKGKVEATTEFEFDGNGNLSKETTFGADGKSYGAASYNYKFDPRGNWVKREKILTYVEKGKTVFRPDMITFRVITYYETEKPRISGKNGN